MLLPVLLKHCFYFLHNVFMDIYSTSWEKATAPYSSTVARKIPWMEEPGRLQSMGSHRVGHDWSDLALVVSGNYLPKGEWLLWPGWIYIKAQTQKNLMRVLVHMSCFQNYIHPKYWSKLTVFYISKDCLIIFPPVLLYIKVHDPQMPKGL